MWGGEGNKCKSGRSYINLEKKILSAKKLKKRTKYYSDFPPSFCTISIIYAICSENILTGKSQISS